MAATLLSNLSAALGHTLPRHTATFDDMSGAAAWAVEAIGQMQAAEIMSGSNNRFMPRNPYAREQSIITMLLLHGVVTREIGEDT